MLGRSVDFLVGRVATRLVLEPKALTVLPYYKMIGYECAEAPCHFQVWHQSFSIGAVGSRTRDLVQP